MSVRAGEAWTARNGHRRWVSMSLGDLAVLWGLGLAGKVILFPFWLCWKLLQAELWLFAECMLLAVTGIVAVWDLAGGRVRFGDLTFAPLHRWGMFMVDVRRA